LQLIYGYKKNVSYLHEEMWERQQTARNEDEAEEKNSKGQDSINIVMIHTMLSICMSYWKINIFT
jgi:hypothetical protein